jgi:hypothetical protein
MIALASSRILEIAEGLPTILEFSDFVAHYGISFTNFSCLFGGAR